MGAEDFADSEVVIAAAATAAALSPRVRDVMRQGAVLGVAGVMAAGEAVVGVAKGAGRTVQGVVPNGGPRRPSRAQATRPSTPSRPPGAAAASTARKTPARRRTTAPKPASSS